MVKMQSLKNAVLYSKETKLDINNITKCIQNSTKSPTTLKNAYTMISMALYLREEFKYFCNKPIDVPHKKFNTTLNLVKQELYKQIRKSK